MAPNRKMQLARAAMLAVAGGLLVAVFNPAAAIERKADHGMTAIDRAADRAVALVVNRPAARNQYWP